MLVGLTIDRDALADRIDKRVDEMVRAGAEDEVRAAEAAGASRTARVAIGFPQLLADDIEGMKAAQRAFARRQLTWMRRMEGVKLIDRSGLDDAETSELIVKLISSPDQ